MSGELADIDGDAAYSEGYTPPPARRSSPQEDFGNRRLDPDHLPPQLTLCTDPEVWAAEFFKAFPELSEDDVLRQTGMTEDDVASWFNAAMETKRMMAIASLPLPPLPRRAF